MDTGQVHGNICNDRKGCDDDVRDVDNQKDSSDNNEDDLVDIEEEVQVEGQSKVSYILPCLVRTW